MTVETTAGNLRAGDVLYDVGVGAVERFTVTSVDLMGPLVIVDFADGTATAPIPANVPVRVRRAS